jgi:hypothetical protein
MEIPRRSIDFVQFGQITFCVLICEDLAQSDTLPEVLRRVGPTLIYAPLLDGPQITSRWAARYASVFADDPGSAVLTLTSFGMVERCQPVGHNVAPVVALWKDPARGTREIRLEAGERRHPPHRMHRPGYPTDACRRLRRCSMVGRTWGS